MLQITQILSPNHWNGREGHIPRWIICHGTAGFLSAKDCAVWFSSRQSQASAHYIVGRNEGEPVYQCVSESNAAWANGGETPGADWWWIDGPNPNLITISIEFIKPHTDNSDQLTEPQKRIGFALIKSICERHRIPKRAADRHGGITGHFSMDPVNRSRCPGPFPWEELWKYLAGNGDDMLNINDRFAKAHFIERGGNPPRWHCKSTGFDIVGAILDYWRRCNGAFRLPKTNEIYNVLPGGGVFQVFEAGVLVYDPNGRFDNPGLGAVYGMHLDQDTPGLRRLMQIAGCKTTQVAPNVAEAARLIAESIAKAQQAHSTLQTS